MTKSIINILFLADTHLGFDLPFKPRIQRRRRGHDFFANFDRALEPALRRQVDLVVHGGDLLFRSRVEPKLVAMAFEPLLQVAGLGIPVYLVPGNHERSQLPVSLFETHPNLFIFDRPRTFIRQVNGCSIALSGFPYFRQGIRQHFTGLVEQTNWQQQPADIRLLCLHQIVEGARVGPANYTFKHNADVICGQDFPPGFAAVLSGHIHRHQVLSKDLHGKILPAPVLYPGSIERTAFAERLEAKGYLRLAVAPAKTSGGILVGWSFVQLPTRPMFEVTIDVNELDVNGLKRKLSECIAAIDPDGILRIRIQGHIPAAFEPVLTAAYLRNIAPATLNIQLAAIE